MTSERAEWTPMEVTRGEALAALPCVVYWGGHNFLCDTVADADATVERLRGSVGEPRWFVNANHPFVRGQAVSRGWAASQSVPVGPALDGDENSRS